MNKQLHRIKVQLNDVTRKEAISLVLRIHEGLIRGTPVDTGWAQSNWLLSVGSSIQESIGSKDNLDLVTQKASIGSILSWQFTQGPAYDTNNVPYIRNLNGGSSKQAPVGFVDKVVQREVSKSNRKKLG